MVLALLVKGHLKKKAKKFLSLLSKIRETSDVFIFAKPRALALFTNRSASASHETKTDKSFLIIFPKSALIILSRQSTRKFYILIFNQFHFA